jgi:hypothetical protein
MAGHAAPIIPWPDSTGFSYPMYSTPPAKNQEADRHESSHNNQANHDPKDPFYCSIHRLPPDIFFV